MRGGFAKARGSCESASRAPMAPSTLRRTCPAQDCVPASHGAERGRGGDLNRRISAPARSASLRAALALGESLAASANAGPAPGAAEGAEREADQIRHAPCLSTAVVMRVQSFSSSGVRRRDDGVIDTRRTDSPAPRPGQTCGAGLSAKRLFFWTVHGPFSFRQDEKKIGGVFSGKLPVFSRTAGKPATPQIGPVWVPLFLRLSIE